MKINSFSSRTKTQRNNKKMPMIFEKLCDRICESLIHRKNILISTGTSSQHRIYVTNAKQRKRETERGRERGTKKKM